MKEEELETMDKEELLGVIKAQRFEIERLTELCNKYEEEHKTTYEIWKKDIGLYNSKVDEIERLNNIINELEKWLKERYDICKKNIDKMEYNEYSHNFYQVANNVNADRKDTLNKLQELKGSESNES